MLKLVLALVVAYLGYRLWLGPSRYRAGRPIAPGEGRRSDPSPSARLDDSAAAARAVLGVGPDADADAIRAAHRRLIAAVHPDRGGSTELTRQINAARDTLLARLG